MPDAPLASVVIPTRDRHASLARTLAALQAQRTGVTWELVVVDDGSDPPVDAAQLERLPAARVLRGRGAGPATARNLGLKAARGAFVVFTDDDTEPEPTWLEAAVRFLEGHPGHVAVEGPVRSPPYDPLRALSLENSVPGAYWTCNMAFRREALVGIGGFDEGFPYPHCEDLDAAFRLQRRGPIGFAERMSIVHHPRAMSFRELTGRGRLTASEIRLFDRHRERYGRARMLPSRLFPLAQTLGFWRQVLRAAGHRPERLARAVALGVVYSYEVTRASLRSMPAGAARAAPEPVATPTRRP